MCLHKSDFKTLCPALHMSIKVRRKLHDMRMWANCESAKHGTIRWYLILDSYNSRSRDVRTGSDYGLKVRCKLHDMRTGGNLL